MHEPLSATRHEAPHRGRVRPLAIVPLVSVLLAFACGTLHAQATEAGSTSARTLDRIVVTATRSAQDAFDIPASIDSVDVDERLRLGASIAELLGGVPGVVARDRQNFAQDTQISIRGFGARSTFGIRGVRLYTDGIPATQPDGQGQVSHFNLDSAGRIEVLRGPFSALYGNASGGVVQIFTADGSDPPEIRVGAAGGSFGARRTSLNARGRIEEFDYNLDYTHFSIDGNRPHSRAERHSLNARLGLGLAGGGTLTLVGNGLRQPFTQDPLGITRQQFEEDPRQVADVAVQYDTRKRVDQTQAGAILEQPVGPNDTFRAMVYGGRRDVVQFLSIPPIAQASPTAFGGVIDLGTNYGGTDLRWTHTAKVARRPLELAAGLAFDASSQHRRGFENFVGDMLGVQGALRRDEIDRVDGFDQYLQADWRLSQRWSALLGVRNSRVALRSDDRYVTAGNPDDSGSVDYRDTTPVAGVMFRATPRLHLYASYGRAFETPTFAEAGYRADGGAGLAFDLKPVTSDNGELGAKWRSAGLEAGLALFQSNSDDELAVATSVGGRTTYQNIGGSRRRGAEFSAAWQFGKHWSLDAAYSHVDARFTTAFLGCSSRCTQPDTPVASGTRIPGVPRDSASVVLAWQGTGGWTAGTDASYASDLTVNDFGTETAPGFALFGAELGRTFAFADGELRTVLRVDNIADRDYVGSVIVNDGNARYYEPGPGRSWLLALRWTQPAR